MIKSIENQLIDTHCHLYLDEFKDDLADYMTRAEETGVCRIYMPSLDSDHLEKMLSVEKLFPGRCFAMAGIHPCYVRDNFSGELDIMKKALESRRFAAIGEIGLDYYWDRSYDDQQMTCFKKQINLAKQFNLPIVIHSRSSMDACIEVLQDAKQQGVKGIFHCFSGNVQNAHDIINCGLLLGIGGVVTYKNAGLAEVVAQVPLDSIVLETDAPYLTPVPFRGKRNESSYLKYIVTKIAEVKNITEEEVARVTTMNALKVFGE
jgi:TatD DNase family protein